MLPTAVGILSVYFAVVAARPEFVGRIPNGNASTRPDSGIQCLYLGHQDCVLGAENNQFGKDFKAAGLKWTKKLCEQDSDGDGQANGEELGDPCCEWVVGKDDVLRLDQLSDPSLPSSTNAAEKCQKNTDPTDTATVTPNASVSANPDASPTSDPSTAATNTPTASTAIDPSPSPRASPSNNDADGAGDDDDDDGVCFPSTAKVTLSDGRKIPMAHLQIGHLVQVAPNTFSPVFMFTHRLPHVKHSFVRLHLPNTVLTVTKSHFLHTPHNGLRRAGDVRVGDELVMGSGEGVKVEEVDEVISEGLYNPQTLHGDIVVEGVVASTYTGAVDSGAAHSLLMPLRAVFRMVGISTSILEGGAPKIVPLLG